MASKPAESIQVGDVVMPPARELSLWMRRYVRENGFSDSALYLTVRAIREGAPDKRGRWLLITSEHAPEWYGQHKPYLFTFKARPDTPWPVVTDSAVSVGGA